MSISTAVAATTTMADTPQKKQTIQSKDYRPISTLHLKAKKEMTFPELIASRGLMSDSYHELKPADLDRGPIPVHPVWREHVWILTRAMVPIVVQQLSYWIWPQYKWSLWVAFPVFVLCFGRYLISTLRHFNHWALIYGTFDEKKIGRDRTPDKSIRQLARGFLSYIIFRTIGEFCLKWNRNESPIDNFSLITPVKMFCWLIVMDYFFYVYHRSCHEVDSLWLVHKQHHTTRHPSPTLSILAETRQEIIEIALVPLLATLVVPMSFHELYLMMCYTGYVEVLGHTGIRADWALPITGPILKWVGMELIVEDHDLHHRYGKSGKNYGKQSRVWDIIFGTTTPREETKGLPGHRET